MRSRAHCAWLLAMFSLLLIPAVPDAGSAVQVGKIRMDRPTLDKPTRIVRRRPVTRKPYVEEAPLLRVEWLLLKRDQENRPLETSTEAIFHDGDRIQFKVKANQRGYLHIFQHTEADEAGEQVFPDSSIRHGNNLVNRYEEIVIPSGCGGELEDRNGNCWFRVTDPPGREIYTIIFSREAFPDTLKGIDLIGGQIALRDLTRIRDTPTIIRGEFAAVSKGPGAASPYAVTVSNRDKRNNEELIVRIALNHK